MVINNYIPAYSSWLVINLDLSGFNLMIRASQPLFFTIPRFREDAVEAYCEWYCFKVKRED